MNARDVIAAALRGYQDDAEGIIDLLRKAAGAGEGDIITIGPDGDVGRLEVSRRWLKARYPDGRPRCNHDDRENCPVVFHEVDAGLTTYRVVVP